MLAYYAGEGLALDGPAGQKTLDTNSAFVARRASPLVEMVTAHLGIPSIDGLRLLDLGCGFGAVAVFFGAAGAQVVGLDRNALRLAVGTAVAHRHGLPVQLVPGRMEALALPDESFDLVVLNNSLCYVVGEEVRRAALRETVRVLRPGGALVTRNPNRWNPIDQFTGLPLLQLLPPHAATWVARALGRERSVTRVTSPPAARAELRAAGFADVVQHGFLDARRPDALKLVARYHHFTALRPSQTRGLPGAGSASPPPRAPR